MPQKIPSFFVNYIENHRIFSGGSMGKIIGKYFAIYFVLRRLAITEAGEI